MGYQSRGRSSPGSFGRGRGIQQHKKAKARSKEHRQKDQHLYAPEKDIPTSVEAVNRTLASLHSLGTQRFVLAPFSEHLNRWLINIKDVLSEFESNSAITLDDQFTEERMKIISDVEVDFAARRDKEASISGIISSLSEDEASRQKNEQDYVTAKREVEDRKDNEIKRLSANVAGAEEEIKQIAEIKTGLFRRVSKEAKSQKEAESAKKLENAQKDLASAKQRFEAEQAKLQEEYEQRKRTLAETIHSKEQEIESHEVDDSLEARRNACDALSNAVNSFARRTGLPLAQHENQKA